MSTSQLNNSNPIPNKQMQVVLDHLAKLGAYPPETVTPQVARQLPTMAEAVIATISDDPLKKAVMPLALQIESIEHKVISQPADSSREIILRIYTPKISAESNLPVVVYFHGGGFVIANLNTYDASCRAICKMAECIVVSVGYAQAPEFPFPAAVEDAVTATKWVMENAGGFKGDFNKIAIAGESAGGNLALAVNLTLKKQGLKLPVHQLLIYPIADFEHQSTTYQTFADAKPLNAPMMNWFKKYYLKDQSQAKNELASVIKGDLAGLPPTTVILAEIDPLRGEGEQLIQKLSVAGVPTKSEIFKGVTHEFFGTYAVVDEAMKAVKLATDELKIAFKS